MTKLEIDTVPRGDYKSADLYLVPKAEEYASLMDAVLEAFDETEVSIVIEESSMPLPYYEALEIPLDVFEEKYDIDREELMSREDAVSMAKDLLSLGLFDIGFEGGSVAVFISHNGYINVKPIDIDDNTFKSTLEEIDIHD